MSEISASQQKQDIELVSRFLLDNLELEQLTARLKSFNVFSILKMESAEIRHSNVLAWLFDPQESHGLGDTLLRRFLSTILLEKESPEPTLTPVGLELSNLGDAEVFREWKNIDILVTSRAANLVVVIENKIGAGVGKGQLEKYKTIISKEYPGYKKIFILLTRLDDGEWDKLADESDYLTWGHNRTILIVEQITKQYRDRIPEEIAFFIDDYIEMVRRITMPDNELEVLCKAIFRKHGHAIRTILKYGQTSQFQTAAEEYLSDHPEWKQLYADPNSVWFIPSNWVDKRPLVGQIWQHLGTPYPVPLRFWGTQEKVGFIMEVGPWSDSHRRLELIKAFEGQGFKMRKKAFQESAKFTRLISEYREIDDPDDAHEIKTTMEDLLKEIQPELKKADSVMQVFNWG